MTIKRMADGLLLGLTQAVDMEAGKIEGREIAKSLERPTPKMDKDKSQKTKN